MIALRARRPFSEPRRRRGRNDRRDNIVNTLGLNYRMTEMEAAVAGVQFRQLDELNDAPNWPIAFQRICRNLKVLHRPPSKKAANTFITSMSQKFDPEVAGTRRDTFVKALTAEAFRSRGLCKTGLSRRAADRSWSRRFPLVVASTRRTIRTNFRRSNGSMHLKYS